MDWGITCFLFFSAVLVLGGVFIEHRKSKLIHLERMAAIEKGVSPASLTERPLQVYFRRGLLWLIPGIGLLMFAYGLRFRRFQHGVERCRGADDLRRAGVCALLPG